MLNLPDKAADDAALDKGSIFFVGTATVILRYGGFTITDPNFLRKGEHAHLGYGLKTPRLTEPAMPFEKLPPNDFVLLSHYHGDHFDQVVEAKLDKNTPIVSTSHAVEQLRERGFQATVSFDAEQGVQAMRSCSPSGQSPSTTTTTPSSSRRSASFSRRPSEPASPTS